MEAYKEADNAALELRGFIEVREVLPYINDFIILDPLRLVQLGADPGVLQQVLHRGTRIGILVEAARDEIFYFCFQAELIEDGVVWLG